MVKKDHYEWATIDQGYIYKAKKTLGLCQIPYGSSDNNSEELAKTVEIYTDKLTGGYLLHFTLKSTTHALAIKPKLLVVCSTDCGRDPGSLKKWHRTPRRACSKTKTIGSAE